MIERKQPEKLEIRKLNKYFFRIKELPPSSISDSNETTNARFLDFYQF
jgi:hypothetical protein